MFNISSSTWSRIWNCDHSYRYTADQCLSCTACFPATNLDHMEELMVPPKLWQTGFSMIYHIRDVIFFTYYLPQGMDLYMRSIFILKFCEHWSLHILGVHLYGSIIRPLTIYLPLGLLETWVASNRTHEWWSKTWAQNTPWQTPMTTYSAFFCTASLIYANQSRKCEI